MTRVSTVGQNQLLLVDLLRTQKSLVDTQKQLPSGQISSEYKSLAPHVATLRGVHERFARRIEERLTSIAQRCDKQKRDPLKVSREVGRLLGQNSRAAGLFDVDVRKRDDGSTELVWKKVKAWPTLAELSEGC